MPDGLNDYGALLDMHRDIERSNIRHLEDERYNIANQINELKQKRMNLLRNITEAKNRLKLYEDMIAMVGCA